MANSYTGLTTINGGTLDGSVSGTLPGNVTVNGGTLELDDPAAMSSTATLTLASAATVNLNYSGTQTIAALYFGSTQQATGLWGAVGNAGATYTDSRFTGGGLLLVCPAPQTITPATSSVCAGATTTASVPITAGATYAWSVNNGTISSGGDFVHGYLYCLGAEPGDVELRRDLVLRGPESRQSERQCDRQHLRLWAGTNVVYNAVNGTTISGIGVMGANWYLNASDDVTAPLPWPNIQSGTVSSSPFTVTDSDATNYSQRFYYLNSP